MMDFPNTPTIGQKFASGTTTWVWDGTAWNIVPQMTPVIPSDLPPSNPAIGQLWFRGTNGKTYIYTDDGTSKQWVEIGASAQANTLWELILLQDFTAITTQTVTDLGAFRDLRFRWDAIGSLSANNSVGVQFSANNGATFFTASSDYVSAEMYMLQLPSTVVSGGANSVSQITLGAGVSNTVSGGNGRAEISRFNKPLAKVGVAHSYVQNTSQGSVVDSFGVSCLQTVACNALRFFIGGGTMTGRMIIEGVRG